MPHAQTDSPLPVGRPRSCHCDECPKCKRAAYMRAWYASKTPEERRRMRLGRDPERVRESDRRKMERRRREGTEFQKQRIRARSEVRLAIARGDLERGICAGCGSESVHAHHDDYDKPLDIVWLCRPCHDELHRKAF